jgi:ABC-type spermidine/putrescine transport system permease subunit II
MLEVGNKAPLFSLPDQNGVIHNLEDYLGKEVVLYFYPKDNTSGCSKQACNFRDLYPQFVEKGAVVLGISKDTFIPLVAGHVTLCAPFVFLSVMPKIKQMDSSIYEAALDLGATPLTALFEIVIPQIVPGIVSGFALAITLSLDDYFISTYTKPAMFDTISTYVVNATKGSQTTIKTALWALSTVIFAVVVLIVIGMNVRALQQEGGSRAKE